MYLFSGYIYNLEYNLKRERKKITGMTVVWDAKIHPSLKSLLKKVFKC